MGRKPKLSAEQVADIRRRWKLGAKPVSPDMELYASRLVPRHLAIQFGVSETLIHQVIDRKGAYK